MKWCKEHYLSISQLSIKGQVDSISGQIYILNGIANMHESFIQTIVSARSGDFSVSKF